jgi:ferredoxin-NADP reductase
LLTARLLKKRLLSERAQCFHLEFEVAGANRFSFTPGQFVSAVAEDANGKQQMRAYSIASAPNGNRFALCLNRVDDGFFSNRLADMEEGETQQFQEPLGFFTLHQPLTDSILIATGTGVAPMRGFLQWLFPAGGPDRSEEHPIWLIYGTRHETELYYRDEFEAYAAQYANFHYLPTLSRAAEDWHGLRGYVQEHAVGIAREYKTETAGEEFGIRAYVCGLSPMINAVRERLKGLGWNRKQIITERYD